MATLKPTALINSIVAGAQSLPGLIASLQAVDPSLATQLESKPLIASKTPWGVLLVAGIAWGSAKYGLGFDATTDTLVAGAGVVLGSYLMRLITKQPVSGVIATPPTPSIPSAVILPTANPTTK
jgi:hypothetical protein